MESCMNDVPSPQISNETEFTTHSSSPKVQCCLGCSKIPLPLISWTLLGEKRAQRGQEADLKHKLANNRFGWRSASLGGSRTSSQAHLSSGPSVGRRLPSPLLREKETECAGKTQSLSDKKINK